VSDVRHQRHQPGSSLRGQQRVHPPLLVDTAAAVQHLLEDDGARGPPGDLPELRDRRLRHSALGDSHGDQPRRTVVGVAGAPRQEVLQVRASRMVGAAGV
jgi:hypothetical protein